MVLGIEGDPKVAPWITRWPAERHLQAIRNADEAHLIVLDGGDRGGFVLLAGLASSDRVIELRRIALLRRDRGMGRQALSQAVDLAFHSYEAKRVWLDVVPENLRARHLYESSGFVADGLVPAGHPSPGSESLLLVMSTRREDWVRRRGPVLSPSRG